MSIKIKVIKIHRLRTDNLKVKGFADVTINNIILIKGIRIVEGKNGLFISMTVELGKNEKWYERVRCLNKEVRDVISKKVLLAYDK